MRLCAGTHFQKLARRLVRVALTLVLMAVVVFELDQYQSNSDWPRGGIALFVLLVLAFLWIGALSHLGAQGFNKILDPGDSRAFDPTQGVQQVDRVGALIRAGKKPAAIRFARNSSRRARPDGNRWRIC